MTQINEACFCPSSPPPPRLARSGMFSHEIHTLIRLKRADKIGGGTFLGHAVVDDFFAIFMNLHTGAGGDGGDACVGNPICLAGHVRVIDVFLGTLQFCLCSTHSIITNR